MIDATEKAKADAESQRIKFALKQEETVSTAKRNEAEAESSARIALQKVGFSYGFDAFIVFESHMILSMVSLSLSLGQS